MPTKRNVYYCCVIKFNCHEKTDHHDFSAICQKLNEMKKMVTPPTFVWLHFPFLQKEKFNLTFCTLSGNKPYLVMDDIHDRKISFKYR